MPTPGLETISRSLLPSLVARRSGRTTGFTPELSPEWVVGLVFEHSRRAQPAVADPR